MRLTSQSSWIDYNRLLKISGIPVTRAFTKILQQLHHILAQYKCMDAPSVASKKLTDDFDTVFDVWLNSDISNILDGDRLSDCIFAISDTKVFYQLCLGLQALFTLMLNVGSG